MEFKKISKRVLFGTAFIVATLGCAKKRPYEEIFKDEVREKGAAIDLSSEYLYVPSMLEAPRTSNATRPGAQGTERIVRFKFTETALIAESVELDPRFESNPTNRKPVVSIPVQHMDFRCADNGAGECSNKEELVDDRLWSEKRYFKTDINGMSVQETNTLPIDLDSLFQPCQTEIGSRVVSSEMAPDAVNIVVEKSYRANLMCVGDAIRDLDELPEALTFNVRYQYSFVKRSSIVSSDYEPIQYPTTDENTFGFFKTERRSLSEDNRDEEKGKFVFMNRWNPKREEIVYDLNPAFAKPEHRSVMKATEEAVAAVNAALAKAEVRFRIRLNAPTEKVSVGDVRRSMIMMVEDPQASGVIGYGPSVKDPRTGEIVSARVIMYYGTMKKFIRNTWEDFVAEERARAEVEGKGKAASVGSASKSGLDSILGRIQSGEGEKTASSVSDSLLVSNADSPFGSYEHFKASLPLSSGSRSRTPSTSGGGIELGLKKTLLSEKGFRDFERTLIRTKDDTYLASRFERSFDEESDSKRSEFFKRRTELLSKIAYPAEYLNAREAIEYASLEGLKDVPKLPWEALNEEHQRKIIDVVLPFVWVPTLIHEIGHNLGLRHNFAGSEDKEHFYSESESREQGHSHPMHYSSVMDYGYSELNSLRMMGKYDVAALRFAYRREVKLQGKGFVSLDGSLEEMGKTLPGGLSSHLVEYKYCTDENVGINPNCRRFDEGTSLKGIAQHLQRAYEESYWRSNFRNGRSSFSDLDDGSYLVRIDDLISNMRPFFEVYDRIWGLFGGDPEKDPQFSTESAASFREYYLDLKAAVEVSRDAILKPILVPDVGCLIYFMEGENAGEQFPIWMRQIGGIVKSCFDSYVVDRLAGAGAIPIAQFGKSFRNEKSPESVNPYADQIDTRGIWGDKLLAVEYLVRRRLGVKSWDDHRGNFLDSTTFQDPVIDPVTGKQKTDAQGNPLFVTKGFDVKMTRIIDGFLLDQVTAPLDLVGADGKVLATAPQFRFAPGETHWIPYQRNRGIRNFFALPSDDVPFAQVLLSTVLRLVGDSAPNPTADTLREYYGVRTSLGVADRAEDYRIHDLGDVKAIAHRGKNAFALAVMDRIDAAKALEPLSIELSKLNESKQQERIRAVLVAASGGESEGLSVAESAAARLSLSILQAFFEGSLKSAKDYEWTLRLLVNAQ